LHEFVTRVYGKVYMSCNC